LNPLLEPLRCAKRRVAAAETSRVAHRVTATEK
jgi:hypothetical protein